MSWRYFLSDTFLMASSNNRWHRYSSLALDLCERFAVVGEYSLLEEWDARVKEYLVELKTPLLDVLDGA